MEPKKPKSQLPEPRQLNITQLAAYLGYSREHVSRNLGAWGFERTPKSSAARPKFLVEDADHYLKHGTARPPIFTAPSDHMLKHGEPEGGW
ncbi:helix-turn-helix domain-containing protein [Mesorhizobium wenxiniae]|uniref:DNA-binding protein n=1 Tax=Mesorhizobium wenxiniae TaxID=2014805 RepID=A0A271K6J6_9HYPH|nr:helix-turn-helix domain-containing protein [Mesorhizobium wenxiniae]PAP91388.1 hypothetical protein CIT31_32450 [Mesorhizobium wenxiniae]